MPTELPPDFSGLPVKVKAPTSWPDVALALGVIALVCATTVALAAILT